MSAAGPSRFLHRLAFSSPSPSPSHLTSRSLSLSLSLSHRIPRPLTAIHAPSRALSSTPLARQSRRQAYTLAHPINADGSFEGVPAPAYVENTASGQGKGKERAVGGAGAELEGHRAPPPPPAPVTALGTKAEGEVKPRRKIQAKKAAITMTPTAITRLKALMSDPNPQLLRIGVKTRGCAGMAYHLDYVSPPGGKFDEVVEQDGVRVLIDSKALFSIIGSRMDWRDTRLSAGFVFDNPNVVDQCGCGESFNIRF